MVLAVAVTVCPTFGLIQTDAMVGALEVRPTVAAVITPDQEKATEISSDVSSDNFDEVFLAFDERMAVLASPKSADKLAAQGAVVLVQTANNIPQGPIWENLEMLLAILATPAMLMVLRQESMRANSLGVIIVVSALYVSASLSMNVLNKKAAHQFKATCLLVIIQMLIADVVIVVMEIDKMKIGKWQDLAKWFVVPVAFAGMLGTSMYAFREASLTTILVLRNILPILTFCIEKALFNQPASASNSLMASLLFTLVGSVLYGCTDISASAWGKILLVVNCLFTIVDRLVQAHLLKGHADFSISLPLCMLLNNSLGILPILGLAVATGETALWQSVIDQADKRTWAMVVISGMVGTSLGYVGLRVQQLVSGTSVLVLQNFNKLLIIAIGMGLFKERMTPLSMAGCVLSLLGSVMYGYMRLPSEANQDKSRSLGKEAQAVLGRQMADSLLKASDKAAIIDGTVKATTNDAMVTNSAKSTEEASSNGKDVEAKVPNDVEAWNTISQGSPQVSQ